MSQCRDCGASGIWGSPFDGEALCRECAGREIRSILAECDRDQMQTLRRRTEDCLRKNPRELWVLLENLIVKDAIKWVDCV